MAYMEIAELTPMQTYSTPLRPLVGLALTLALFGTVPADAAPLPAAVDGQQLPSLAPMLERTIPAVVNISTVAQIEEADHPLLRDPYFRRFFDIPEHRKREESSLGSGVIVDAARGLALTNHHVISQADEIRVTLHDGRTLKAELVGADPETDVAVLRLPTEGLSALPLGDSDRLRVGDFVVAIGTPFGLRQTVTSGIVSGLGRSGLGIEGYESFIQTDASINPGNSGGPLVNLRGELVGINTAILAPGGGNIGIGFAIPIAMARSIMDQILAHGSVSRGLFGVAVQDLTPDLARAMGISARQGAVVTAVEPGSAAAEAGVAEGDAILKIDGLPVSGASDIRTRFGLLRVGAKVKLEVMRAGQTLALTGRIADPYQDFARGERIAPTLAGALLGDGNDQTPAVRVGRVSEDSPAWTSGLREGDLILGVNRSRIGTLRELSAAIRQDRGLYSLRVQRGDRLILLSQR